jgi:Ca2+:H+ antiporter
VPPGEFVNATSGGHRDGDSRNLLSNLPSMARPVTTEDLSLCVSVLMIMSYLASLWFALRTHSHFYQAEVEDNEAKWSVSRAIIILLLATLAVGWVSDILVRSIEPVRSGLG